MSLRDASLRDMSGGIDKDLAEWMIDELDKIKTAIVQTRDRTETAFDELLECYEKQRELFGELLGDVDDCFRTAHRVYDATSEVTNRAHALRALLATAHQESIDQLSGLAHDVDTATDAGADVE